jgi:glycerol uptake facilitator protein
MSDIEAETIGVVLDHPPERWTGNYVNELVGTFVLVLIGNGAVASSVLTGSFDLLGVALLWGLGVAFAIYWAGGVSSAHLNPAVTAAMVVWRDFPPRRVPGYVGAQLAGAFLAAATVWVVWGGYYRRFHEANGVVVGEPGSEITGMTLWTFFPNPAVAGVVVGDVDSLLAVTDLVTLPQAFLSEVLITAILVGVIFALVDERNPMGTREAPALVALLVGLLVAMLVQFEAPISMAALNPARDLGPRLFGYLVGYGEVAIPGLRGEFWVPTLSTLVGGLLGGGLYDLLTRRYLDEPTSGTVDATPPNPEDD